MDDRRNFPALHENLPVVNGGIYLVPIVLLGLLLREISLILDFFITLLFGRNSGGTACPNNSKAFLHISEVVLSCCFKPSIRTS